MQYEIRIHRDLANGNVPYIVGQCPVCVKANRNKGINGLICMSSKDLTPRLSKLVLRCLVCKSKVEALGTKL